MAQRQVYLDGGHEDRAYLSVTVIVNHDLADGGPAARFVRRLEDLVQSAEGLAGGDETTGGAR